MMSTMGEQQQETVEISSQESSPSKHADIHDSINKEQLCNKACHSQDEGTPSPLTKSKLKL